NIIYIIQICLYCFLIFRYYYNICHLYTMYLLPFPYILCSGIYYVIVIHIFNKVNFVFKGILFKFMPGISQIILVYLRYLTQGIYFTSLKHALYICMNRILIR